MPVDQTVGRRKVVRHRAPVDAAARPLHAARTRSRVHGPSRAAGTLYGSRVAEVPGRLNGATLRPLDETAPALLQQPITMMMTAIRTGHWLAVRLRDTSVQVQSSSPIHLSVLCRSVSNHPDCLPTRCATLLTLNARQLEMRQTTHVRSILFCRSSPAAAMEMRRFKYNRCSADSHQTKSLMATQRLLSSADMWQLKLAA